MKFESHDADERKARWKVVRRDFCTEVPGTIVQADEETGNCTLLVTVPGGDKPETKTYSFGVNGLALVPR